MNTIDSKIRYAKGKLNFFLTRIRRYWIALIIVAIISGVAGGVISMIMYKPVYTATQAFTIELEATTLSKLPITDSQLSKTLPSLINSDAFMDYMMPYIKQANAPGRFRVNSLSNTNIFYLEVESSSKKNCEEIIRIFKEEYPALTDKIIGKSEMHYFTEASISNMPSNMPNYTLSVLIGVAIGLVLVLAILALQAIFTKTIFDPSEAEKFLNSKCLAVISEIKVKKRSSDKNTTNKMPLVTDESAPLELKQSINKIAVRAMSKCEEKSGNAILVTSTIAGEGKTSVAVNLACSIAELDKRVLIIDCDLRSPSVLDTLGIDSNDNRLTNTIEDKCNIKNAIINTGINNLYALANSTTDKNASENAVSKELKDIIESSKKEFDYVILDTPPVGFLGDGLSISDCSNEFIYVISHNYINANYVKRSLESFNGSKTDMLGFVINHKH